MQTAKVSSSMGRLPTAQKQINADSLKSIGFTTNVKVEERAVTRQGLEGIKSKGTKKVERKIQDKYYYTELFKKKITEAEKEILKSRNEIDHINNDIASYNTMNKTFETLSKDVQNLEGELADYNLAGDKYRSMMRAEDIEAVYTHIKMNNKKKREDSDYLYLEKAKKEEELHKIDYETNLIMQNVEQRLMDLEPDQKIEYEQAREENAQYIAGIHNMRDQINRLNDELIEGENLLKNNPNKKEAHKTKDAINALLRKKEELELQTNESGLSVEELKQRLVNKYKDDSAEKVNIDKKIAEMKRIIEALKKSVSDVEKEMKNSSNYENAKAHESIFQKDKEYSTFIENFEELKKNQYREMECKEEMIVALLQNISERINNKTLNTNPTASTSLKGDLDFKKDLIKKSASTLEEAKAQYEALSVKMERLGTLDETLKKEIKSYKEKLEKCNKDLHEKYERIDFHKDFLKSEEKRMNEVSPYLEKNKDNYNKLLTSLILKTRSKSTNLEDLDTYKKLREFEKKIQENENYIFSLQSYIDSKAMENDFSHLLKEVMDLQREINEELIKRNS